MDLVTSLIGIGFLLLFMLPIVWVIYKQTQQHKSDQKKLMHFANQQKLQLRTTEISHRLMMGIDIEKKQLVYASKTDQEPVFHQVDLHKVTQKRLNIPETNVNGIERVSLILTDASGERELIFYDDYTDIGVDANISKESAKKWLSQLTA